LAQAFLGSSFSKKAPSAGQGPSALMMQEPPTEPPSMALGQFKPAQDPQTTVSKKGFSQGVALVHTLLLCSVFVPPVCFCIQMANNADLEYFVGTLVAQRAYELMIVLIALISLMHIVAFVPTQIFWMSFWLPGLGFAGVGYYYGGMYGLDVTPALLAMDCDHYRTTNEMTTQLHTSYVEAQGLYHECHGVVKTSIEDCEQYGSLFSSAPVDFMYLKGLEQRFQCAGICNSAVRLWDQPGTPAPACGLFAVEWLKGATSSAHFVMWYGIIVFFVSIPVFVTMLDSFFYVYYNPILGKIPVVDNRNYVSQVCRPAPLYQDAPAKPSQV